jgi:hypothetical protein
MCGSLGSSGIGALGQEGSYGNDGRFHPIPVTQNFPCDRTDASGRLFVDVFEQKVVASAAFGGHGPGCIANQPPARVLRHHPLPRVATCPPRDLTGWRALRDRRIVAVPRVVLGSSPKGEAEPADEHGAVVDRVVP